MEAKILVIGDAIVDHYIFCNVDRMSPEDVSVPILDVQKEECRLGGALNVAANIASLRPTLKLKITVSSMFTPFCKAEIIKRGMSYEGILLPEEFGIIKTRLIKLSTNKQVARVDRNKQFCEKAIVSYKKGCNLTDLDKFDYVVISDYCKGVVDQDTINRLSSFKGVVFVDTKKKDLSIWDCIPNCFIKVNFNEWHNARQQSKHPVVVTVGEVGAELHNTQDWHDTVEFRVEPIDNADVVGCGDVFLAGLVVEYSQSKNIGEAIKYANQAAGESARRQGTVEVTI
jgi:D-beta-D-heptose 7-phosphate kinase/D-beta-D-heptose 1-phosphate adenosyltransferase